MSATARVDTIAEYAMFEWHDEARAFWFAPHAVGDAAEFFLVGLVIGLAIHNSARVHTAMPCGH